MAADCVPRGGDPGDHIGGASAVVVEPPADGVFVVFPGTDVELSDLRDHVRQSVGGSFVVWVGLVLVWIQLTAFEDDAVRVVVEHGLSVLEALMKVFRGERLHLSGARHCGELSGYTQKQTCLYSKEIKTAYQRIFPPKHWKLSPYLWLIHPGHINLLGAIRALESVCGVNRDVVEGVIQADKPWAALVELADLFERLVLEPSRQRAHVQELFALRREFFLHLCSCHHDNKKTDERVIRSVDSHGENVQHVSTVLLIPLKHRPALCLFCASCHLQHIMQILIFVPLQVAKPLPCLISL